LHPTPHIIASVASPIQQFAHLASGWPEGTGSLHSSKLAGVTHLAPASNAVFPRSSYPTRGTLDSFTSAGL
jgi:hypothetical protein